MLWVASVAVAFIWNKGIAETQRQRKGGELETRRQKASTERVTDSAFGPH